MQSFNPRPTSSTPLHRCFHALHFSAEVVEYLENLIGNLRRHGADVRWSRARHLHLTLRFLGDITDAQLTSAMAQMREASLGAPFRLLARGLGAFPALRAPRVIWAGVAGEFTGDTHRLTAVQQTTEHWARALGLTPEGRRYSPHITLGRVPGASAGLHALMDEIITGTCESPATTIDRISLMRSELHPDGPRYEVMAETVLTDTP